MRLGELNEKETLVWQAVWEASGHGDHYAPLDEIRARLPEGISRRAFSGYMGQLAQKGYLFAFSNMPYDLRDVEVSCDAARAAGVEKRGSWCNCEACSCHERRDKKEKG